MRQEETEGRDVLSGEVEEEEGILRCEGCGLTYSEMRTGLSYGDVYGMLWVGSEDSEDWRYKRRGSVLGLWRQIKMELWDRHIEGCQEKPRETENPEEKIKNQKSCQKNENPYEKSKIKINIENRF